MSAYIHCRSVFYALRSGCGVTHARNTKSLVHTCLTTRAWVCTCEIAHGQIVFSPRHLDSPYPHALHPLQPRPPPRHTHTPTHPHTPTHLLSVPSYQNLDSPRCRSYLLTPQRSLLEDDDPTCLAMAISSCLRRNSMCSDVLMMSVKSPAACV